MSLRFLSRRYALLTLTLALLCSAPSAILAQQSLGTISGTIADQTGAIVPGSVVTIVDEQTAATRTMHASGAVAYSFQALPIGSYTLTVTMAGFNTERIAKVVVQADRTSTQNVK